MQTKHYSFLLFLILSQFCFAQNLVPNPSFEDTVFETDCYCSDQIELCTKNWFNPHGATPDYYTYFPGYCSGVSSHNNPSGFQQPRTGVAYVGIYGITSPTREYCAIKLKDSLVMGECYYAEFYVSLANLSMYAIDNLGCFFTDDTNGYKSITTNIPVFPQIVNPGGNFLSDTINWQKISGTFTAAGGECFLVVGNFFDDAHTSLSIVNSGTSWQAAYYYIDDVLVSPCDSITGVNSEDAFDNMLVYPSFATSFVFVSANTNTLNNCTLKVFDTSGKDLTAMITVELKERQWMIDITNLSNGMYILNVINGYTILKQSKFFKQP